MSDDERRKRDSGAGYPEEAPAGTGVDPRDHPENDVTPEHDAPRTSAPEDRDPAHATGNPHAAGGDAD